MSEAIRIRLGTRTSDLAQWQANWVTARLEETGVEVEMVPITTTGDRNQQGPIGSLGSQGLFTKEIQAALLEDRIDLAVHSLKDLPTDEVPGLILAAVPGRASVRDVLATRHEDGKSVTPDATFDSLPKGAVVGTGSLRRQSQLLHARPDLRMEDIRGNVDTRLRKLDEKQYDAIVLAEAGLRRLELSDRITFILPGSLILPAIGQGALGLETRTDDGRTRDALSPLGDSASFASVTAERTLLAALQGGCLAPIAALGRVEDGKLYLTGCVLSPDGAERIEATGNAAVDQAVELGQRVAADLLDQGAADLVEASRGSS